MRPGAAAAQERRTREAALLGLDFVGLSALAPQPASMQMGLGGAVHAHFVGYVSPEDVLPNLTFQLWAMLIGVLIGVLIALMLVLRLRGRLGEAVKVSRGGWVTSRG